MKLSEVFADCFSLKRVFIARPDDSRRRHSDTESIKTQFTVLPTRVFPIPMFNRSQSKPDSIANGMYIIIVRPRVLFGNFSRAPGSFRTSIGSAPRTPAGSVAGQRTLTSTVPLVDSINVCIRVETETLPNAAVQTRYTSFAGTVSNETRSRRTFVDITCESRTPTAAGKLPDETTNARNFPAFVAHVDS